MKAVLADGLTGDSAPDRRRDWVMTPPRNPDLAAGEGFGRREVDGLGVVFFVMRPRSKRDWLGRTVLDADGLPVWRTSGRTDTPNRLKTEYEFSHHERRTMHGHLPRLPAIIKCGHPGCGTFNRVELPADD